MNIKLINISTVIENMLFLHDFSCDHLVWNGNTTVRKEGVCTYLILFEISMSLWWSVYQTDIVSQICALASKSVLFEAYENPKVSTNTEQFLALLPFSSH